MYIKACSRSGSYLGLLLLRGVDDGGATHLGDLAALTVERPAADLVSDHVLDEEHTAVEAKGELVKQLNVLQHVVIRVARRRNGTHLLIISVHTCLRLRHCEERIFELVIFTWYTSTCYCFGCTTV